MIRLITTAYTSENKFRNEELSTCLFENLRCVNIDEVVLFGDGVESEHPSVVCVDYKGKIMFRDYFNFVSQVASDDDISIIANSDIFFDDENLKKIEKYLTDDVCFALSRYDVRASGEVELFNRRDSQDAWIIRGKPKQIKGIDIYQGIAGIDNALANRLHEAGYTVLNPSLSIKSFHLHNTNYRTYNPTQAVDKPYLLITPHKIYEKPTYHHMT